jgi:REP element-mobilizing transposase RayT
MKRGFRGGHERGYLPHRDEPGLTQFVTFRLADSFPLSLRSEWEYFWRIEENRERRRALEAYLDLGRGVAYLGQVKVAALVEGSLRHFDGQRYELRAWVIMPNQVHVLLKVTTMPMSHIVENWKKYTPHEANKALGLVGQFWAEDYWDTFMRDAAHELKSRRYTENNPVKAKLALEPRQYPWSSARFRDENGMLRR